MHFLMSFQHQYVSLVSLETPKVLENTILSVFLLLPLSVNVSASMPIYQKSLSYVAKGMVLP